MKTVYDVQQLLRRFGIFVYVGDRVADLELMQIELSELYKQGCILAKDYQMATLLLKREIRSIKKGDSL